MPDFSSYADAPAATAWTPHGFSRYRQYYPATPDLRARRYTDASDDFIETWNRCGASSEPHHRAKKIGFVIVRGLFGGWIPRHFRAPLEALLGADYTAMIAHSRPAGTIAANAAAIGRDVEARIPREHRLLFLCHSKGGLDTLAMLLRFPNILRRTAALVLCQTPRAGCAVLESILLGRHRPASNAHSWGTEGLLRSAIGLAGASHGCLDITAPRIDGHVVEIDRAALAVPIVSVASWSITPTAWLDSQHARLQAIRPGCAHDGLFFLEDLLWPGSAQILLPHIDHSQPTVGGKGFDHGRFWLALARLALQRC
jgi:hypothetical protein